MRWTLVALGVLAAVVTARGLARHNTWYLASDQFAFLAFADDLRHGRALHDPAPLEALGARAPGPGESADAYYQTYIWRDARLFSRYPPGFPLLLAAAALAGGETAMHWLNAGLYLLLLGLLGLLAGRLLRDHDTRLGAGAAVAAAWALLVIPTQVHYWGITIARDLPAHLIGLGAVLAAWERRLVLAGLLLGFACSVRPDAVLYGLSVGALALSPPPRMRVLGAGAVAFLVGAAPLFAYNILTLGHPLRFTQGMEFRDVLGALLAPPAAMAAEAGGRQAAGGAFRLANLATTLPAHLTFLAGAFRCFLLLALGATAWGLVRRPRLVAALVPYALAALLFFSCWGHPDPRYLVGTALAVLVMAAIGAVLWGRALTDPRWRAWQRLAAAALTAGVPFLAARLVGAGPRLAALELILAGTLASLALVSLPRRGRLAAIRLAPLVPALALAVAGIVRVVGGTGSRDPFQAAQVAQARAAIESLVPAEALVLTSTALGRPAENLTRYTHAEAFYPGDLHALGTSVAQASLAVRARGRRVFLLLGTHESLPLGHGLAAEPIARREGPALYDWFIDPRRARAGAVLAEVVPAAEAP